MNNNKRLIYYLDSKKYNYDGIQKNIDETKKQYNKKEIEVNVEMNQYRMYVITFYIKNKDTFFNKIRVFFRKNKKPLLQEKNNNVYGKYKSGTIFYPY